jgi:hypothetical protein
MKRLFILLMPLMLAACATFDNNEYSRMVDMRYGLSAQHCDDPRTARIMANQTLIITDWLNIYSRYLPNNTNTRNMLETYRIGVKDFVDRYESATSPSAAFCRLRVKNLHDQLDIMLDTTARRPR